MTLNKLQGESKSYQIRILSESYVSYIGMKKPVLCDEDIQQNSPWKYQSISCRFEKSDETETGIQ